MPKIRVENRKSLSVYLRGSCHKLELAGHLRGKKAKVNTIRLEDFSFQCLFFFQNRLEVVDEKMCMFEISRGSRIIVMRRA